MLFTLSAIIFLLAANALFVAAEFALVKVRASRLEQDAEAGSRGAKRALGFLDNLEPYLAACQLGITMASLGLGWVGEPFVAALLEPLFHKIGLPAGLLHPLSFAIGFLIFSSLHIIIGEQVPKTFAIRNAETTAKWVSLPTRIFYVIAWPLTMALNWASNSLLKLMGVAEASHEETHSKDELRALIGAGQRSGELVDRQADMLDKLFDFNARTVAEVMTPRGTAAFLDVTLSNEANREIMRNEGHSRYPLINSQNDEILGIILVKDFYEAVLDGKDQPWNDLPTYLRSVMMVPELTRIDRLLDRMRSEKSHIAVVVDEYGVFAGLVTLEDLIEEIVGDIDDEHDTEDESFTQLDNMWEVDGLLGLHDLADQTGLNFDDFEQVNTVSGLFMLKLGRIPKIGDHIRHSSYRLEVIGMDGQRVGRVRIRPIPKKPLDLPAMPPTAK